MEKKVKFRRWKDPIYTKEEFDDDEDRTPLILTPQGLVSIKLHGSIKNSLKFYECHTNFDVGVNEKEIIENTPGINILEIFSAYAFRFNVGSCFNVREVMKNLRNRLCGISEQKFSKEIVIEIYNKQMELKESGEPSFIYILPNGKCEGFHSKNKKEYEAQLSKYLEAQREFGGEILYGG
jgi:hypothetical protein